MFRALGDFEQAWKQESESTAKILRDAALASLMARAASALTWKTSLCMVWFATSSVLTGANVPGPT